MREKLIPLGERRSGRRFSIRLPLTVITPTENVSAFTRDLSDTGVYFYVLSEDLELISPEFECRIEFPAEITMSTSRRMYFKGTLLRTEKRISGEVGLAAKLCKVEALDRC
jgi:PilZ domain